MTSKEKSKQEYLYDFGDYEPNEDKKMAPEIEALDKCVKDKVEKIKKQREIAINLSNTRKRIKDEAKSNER